MTGITPSANNLEPSAMLQLHAETLASVKALGPVLDLACGNGRNGLSLVLRDYDVVFADNRAEALQDIAATLATQQYHDIRRQPHLWEVDLENSASNPLAEKNFAAVLVFRYLHRPLFESIKHAIAAGGLILYETFTVDQSRYGRPTNPDFLLQRGELAQRFVGWEVQHYFEGVVAKADGEGSQAIAQIVATKPG